jgi:metal-responsive CopG/Arc/MetJ family transcriptional regulator
VKTAISLPDEIFEEAERLARRRGMSRSELYARAVAEFVKGERFLGVRELLDSVYAADPNGSRLDPALGEMQARSLPKEEW